MGRDVFRLEGCASAMIAMFLTLTAGGSEVAKASPAAADPGSARAFEANVGQFPPEADFVLRMAGRRVLFDGARTVLGPLGIRGGRRGEPTVLQFLGTDPGSTLDAIERLPGVVHYVAGTDRERWLTDVPTYAALVRRGLWPGIDLVYRASGGRVDLELVVGPGADPSSVVLDCGRLSTLTLDAASGDAVLEDGAGSLRLSRPVGASDAVAASWRLAGSTLSLIVAGRQASGVVRLHTSIDLPAPEPADSAAREPVAPSIATDGSGSVWVAGAVLVGPQTSISDRGQARTRGGRGRLSSPYPADVAEAFVTRFDATGSTAEETVFFGGAGDDSPRSLALAPDGRLVVVGFTTSTDFPGAAPRSSRDRDAFVMRLDSDIVRSLRSLVFGGTGDDEARVCAAGATGSLWVAGRTSSPDFPLLGGPALPRAVGGADAFVARIDARWALARAAVLGGSGQDEASGLRIDDRGAVYLAGTTDSADFPSIDPIQQRHGGGVDAFVVKLDTTGVSAEFSTYLGGSGDETGLAIALDASGDLVLAGTTTSADFPIQEGEQPMRGGSSGGDAFLVRLDVAGGAIRYATYLGGADDDRVGGMVLDPGGTAWISGTTLSERLGTAETVRLGPGGGMEAFSASVASDGTGRARATLLAGDADDAATGIALGPAGTAFIAGLTASRALPGASRAQVSFSGDVFVARVVSEPAEPGGGVLCPDVDADGFALCGGGCILDVGDQCGDCDDANDAIHPGAPELCDGVDEDCSGLPVDEADADGDGFRLCQNDCDDGNAAIHPGAPELCNGVDEDCSGAPVDEADADGDGFRLCQNDCDDGNAAIHPNATEQCNTVDDDCDGDIPANEVDADGDGFRVCQNDCNDTDASIHPGAPEQCNGLDDDCNGAVPASEADADADGFRVCQNDCNDTNAGINPGAFEQCNGVDDDCSGAPGADEADGDGDGFRICDGDCNDGSDSVFPGAPERCNGRDDDCDGVVPPSEIEQCNGLDDDCDGVVHPIEADADGDGYRLCQLDCDDNNAAVNPGASESGTEACSDSLDNDCDGSVDSQDADCFTSAPTTCATLGDQTSGTIDEDVWRLTGAQGEGMTVTLAASDGAGGRADLVLIDDMGAAVSVFQMDRTQLPNQVTATLPAAGPYHIVVREHPAGLLLPGSPFRGVYCLSIDASGGAAQTLAPTSSVEGTSTNR